MSQQFHQSARTDGFTIYMTENKGVLKKVRRNLDYEGMIGAVKEYAEKGCYCIEIFNEKKVKEADGNV